LILDTTAITATSIETELKVLLDGGNSAKSSKIQIEVIHGKKPIMPSFSEKVPSFTILLESGKNLKFVSSEVTDPDA
jgi:hypothetical protein